jgi:hypothetical protein
MTAQDHPDSRDTEALAKFFLDISPDSVAPYALVRRGKVMCFFGDADVAADSGSQAYPDRAFSVIDVRARRVVRRR